MIKKDFSLAGSILAGLFTSQLLASIHVYISNMETYRRVTEIKRAGYLPIPNALTIPTLKELGSAFSGGLFFTLTVGSTITLAALAALWTWINIFKKNKYALIPFFLLWIGCLVEVNACGFTPMISSYFIIVPLAVLISARPLMASDSRVKSRLRIMIMLAPVILLSILWSTLLGKNLFVNIRDYLLLSNPVGIKINDFYYGYTLYAANLFKPLNQKTLKTSSLWGFDQNPSLRLLEDRLLYHDYLILETDSVDLRIEKQGDELVFKNRGKEILRTSQEFFLSNSTSLINRFSEHTDRYIFFRNFTYFSILTGFPIMLYIIVYAALQRILRLVNYPTTSIAMASTLCLLIGVVLFIPVYKGQSGDSNMNDIEGLLKSERWQDKVTALRKIQEDKLEIADYPHYLKIKDSPHIPVRYWLTRAIGISKRPETYNDLLVFLDDSHPNVVCQALYGLGRRGDNRAIDIIFKKIQASLNWYVQWYAYRAMRNLGWKQAKSI